MRREDDGALFRPGPRLQVPRGGEVAVVVEIDVELLKADAAPVPVLDAAPSKASCDPALTKLTFSANEKPLALLQR